MRTLSRFSLPSKLFICLVIAYAALTVLLPVSAVTKAELNVNNSQYFLLLLLIRAPIIAVWCLAFYAYRRLVEYTKLVKDSEEGKHFETITRGVTWIVWGLVVPALMYAILNAVSTRFHGFLHINLIVTNYVYVIVTAFAFSYISAGAHRFATQSKVQPTARQIRVLIFSLVLIGVIYCYLISRQLSGTDITDAFNAFYLPNGLVWLTIVVPYLYAWFLGIFAALEIILVAHKSQGIIYQQALRLVAIGLVTIIVSLFVMHYYRAILPRTGHVTLGLALLMSYATYASSAAGSLILIAGARKLKKIEEL